MRPITLNSIARRAPILAAAAAAFMLAVTGACAAAQATTGDRDSITTVYVVRHAERNDNFVGTDMPLSEAGSRRAIALAHTLRDAGITSIYATHFRRCRDTGGPLADSLGVKLRIDEQADAKTFAARIRSECAGRAALVIGHSDTVPAIVSALAGIEVPPFVAGEWDRLYVITLAPHGTARVVLLRYGEPIARAK